MTSLTQMNIWMIEFNAEPKLLVGSKLRYDLTKIPNPTDSSRLAGYQVYWWEHIPLKGFFEVKQSIRGQGVMKMKISGVYLR